MNSYCKKLFKGLHKKAKSLKFSQRKVFIIYNIIIYYISCIVIYYLPRALSHLLNIDGQMNPDTIFPPRLN